MLTPAIMHKRQAVEFPASGMLKRRPVSVEDKDVANIVKIFKIITYFPEKSHQDR